MKKEKKERFGFFKKIQEYRKVPRYRALMTLGLYFLFFAGIYIYIQAMSFFAKPVEEQQKVDAVTALSYMDNYEYEYKIDAVNKLVTSSYKITGMRYSDKDNFKIGQDSFYVQDNVIYSNGLKQITDILPIDLLLLRPNQIYEFLKSSTSANKVEYQNGDVKVTYQVPVYIFKIAFLQDIDDSNIETVEITTYEKNYQIYKIDINAYNLMKLVDSTLEGYSIQMTYMNINNIKNVEELK